MPTRLLLDGEDLQSLMLRVRDEMGPDARIVKAERIRTGGIGGFFAKEHFELTVEVPDRTRTPRRRRPAPRAAAVDAPAGIDALLAAADAADDALDSDDDGDLTVVEVPAAPSAPAASTAPAATAASPAAPEAPVVSTTGSTFAEVLESMRLMVGPPPAAPPRPAAPAEPEAPSEDDPAQDAGVDDTTPASDDAAADEAASAGAPVPPAVPSLPAVPAAPGPPDRSGSSVGGLLELGIPARLLSGFADLHASVPLSVLVRRFDPPPPLRITPGRVIAVVGEGAAALRTATQMANRAGIDPHDVVLAGEIDPVPGHGRRLQTVAAVARYRVRIDDEVPTVVVVGVSTDPQRWAEAAALVEALEPDSAWAVVDARLKAGDLRRWLRHVGARRPIDAVAAMSTFEAQAPGTVLNLGLPVGWVDGLPASPVVWAAVLSERLADDARWD